MTILQDKTKRGRAIALATVIACVIGVLCILQVPQNAISAVADRAYAASSTEVHYYAQDVEGNGYEFGPPGSSLEDMLKRVDPAINPAPDPALAAAILYDAQYKFGQNFIEQNINPANAKVEINALHQTFRENRDLWKNSVQKYRSFLFGCQTGIESNIQYASQMYMYKTGASFDANAPVVIWQQTGAPGGPEWLVIRYGDKQQELHLSCGYQPGADIYVYAQAHPGQYTPDTPTPTPPSPTKDPNKDPVNQGNAERGGGYNYNPDGSIDWSPGEYQPTRPTWQPSGGDPSPGSDPGGGQVTPTPAPPTPVQPAKPGTKDGGDQGEFQ